MILIVFLGVSACGKSNIDYVKQNMSEKTDVFFFGENKNFYATLAIGTREKNYYMDGKSGEVVSFSLLSLKFFEERWDSVLKTSVSVGDETFEVEMEFNPMNSTYMVDLEKEISQDAPIVIKCADELLGLTDISKDFGVDSNKAIEIACDELQKQIEEAKEISTLLAECYLKILDKQANNFEDFFWCFTLLTEDNKSFSVVISTTDGKILAKTK